MSGRRKSTVCADNTAVSNKAVSQHWRGILRFAVAVAVVESSFFLIYKLEGKKRGHDETLCSHCCWNLTRLEVAVGRETIAWQWQWGPWLAAPLLLFIYLFECSAPAPARCWRLKAKKTKQISSSLAPRGFPAAGRGRLVCSGADLTPSLPLNAGGVAGGGGGGDESRSKEPSRRGQRLEFSEAAPPF